MTEPDTGATAPTAPAKQSLAHASAPVLAQTRRSGENLPPQKVVVPGASYKAIGELKRGQEQDGDVIARALRWLDTFDTLWRLGGHSLTMSLLEFAKATNSQYRMKAAGYSNDMASSICRALFCEQTEEHLKEAFNFYDKNSNGYIDKAELRAALPLMGEDMSEGRMDELFGLVDKDKNGLIDVNEFSFLVKAMNPKGSDAGFEEALRSLRVTDMGSAVTGTAAVISSTAGSTFSAMSTAWNANLSINPFSMRQAGASIEKMKSAGADDKTAAALVQAYFSNQSLEQMQKCFDDLDTDKSGYLDKAELRKFLPCLEDIPDEKFEEMFSHVDKDSSGKIEFEEFRALIKALGEGTFPNFGQMGQAFDKMVSDGWFM